MATNTHGPWPIDVEKLKRQALELEAIAKRCAQESERAGDFYRGLSDYIEKAKAGQITTTLKSAPGSGRMILEGYLDEFPDLLVAYSAFRLNLTLGESELGKSLKRRALTMVEEIKKEDEDKN